MEIVVIADGIIQNEFNDKGIPERLQVQHVTSIADAHDRADAYFFLLPEHELQQNLSAIEKLNKLVFTNAVTTTLEELPANCVRLNAWPGFLFGSALEVVATEHNKAAATRVLDMLQWKYHFIPDVIGMITPRTVAMIVNEAYFALGDEVSTKQEIDIAMKLGTGYPFGPFEWSEKIGEEKIIHLLHTLSLTDKRYEVAPLLKTKTNQ
jgi:3-hydroxybutyryl-CoA dehydrogenase